MFRYPLYKQDNNYSCGAYCIKMILKFYHLDVEIKEIKSRCKMTNDGITVFGMVKCLESYHFDVKAYQSDLETLIKEAKLPCIIHVLNDDMTHYVVLYRVSKNYLIIGDPARGLVKEKYEDIEKKYTGICICINHVGRYVVDSKNRDISFQEFVLCHLKENYNFIIKLVVKAMIISLCSIIGSYYFQGLIDQVSEMSYLAIILFSSIFVVVAIIRIVVNYQRKRLEIEIQRYLNQEYVNKTVTNMLYLPFSYYQNNQEGVVLTKVQNLFQLSEFFIHLYTTVFIDLILIIGLLMALAFFSMQLVLIVIVFLSVISLIVIRRLKSINDINKQIINSQELMNQGHLEYLKNIYNSHQFFLKRYVKEKINYLFEEYNYNLYRRDNDLNQLNIVSELLIQLLSFVVVIISCFYYKASYISIGDIIFFYMLVSYMIEPLFNLIAFVIEKDEVLVLYERYKEIIPDKKEKKIKLKKRIKEIKFDHISYSYGYSKPVIEHLDLIIDKSICIQGSTGAGKSTLLKLLMKYDELLKGNIYINGINLKDIDANSLYQKIIYLNKEPVFYHESLRFNLLLNGKDEFLMKELLQEFELYEYIRRLDLPIDVDGQPLSSGQGQIMMLIRAILKKPEVLVLDEAMCNVDEDKVKKILMYIEHHLPEMIVIIVAHQTKIVNELYDCVIIRNGKIYK